MKKNWYPFFGSAVLFFVLSACLYFFVPTKDACLEIDSVGYDRVAHNFSMTNNLSDPHCPQKATVQTLGYHFFLGLFYKLFGHRFWPVVWFQIFLTVFSLLFLFLIAHQLFGARVASVAVFLGSINIGFLVYPQFLLAESLLLFLILFFLQRFILFWRTQKTIHLVQAGLIGGISILIKPSALLFLPLAALFLFFCFASRKSLKNAFIFTVCFSAPVFGYLTYNKVRFGYFNLAPMKSLNLYHVFLSKVIAHVHNIPVADAEKKIPPFSSKNTLDERGWDGARALFWNYEFTYPFTCIFVWMKNVSKTCFGLFSTQLKVLLSEDVRGGDVSFFSCEGSLFSRAYQYITKGSSGFFVTTLAFAEVAWSFLRLFLVVLAMFLLLWMRRYCELLFFLTYLICFSFVTGFDGCCRYRILFEPVLILFSSLSLVFLYDRLFHRGEAG